MRSLMPAWSVDARPNSMASCNNGTAYTGGSSDGGRDRGSTPALVASIERLGCHIPRCVARSLQENPFASETQMGEAPPSGRSSQRLSWATKSLSSRRDSCDSGSSRSSRAAVPGQFSMPLPDANVYNWTAMLMVDISGFTRLSTLLEVEPLSKAINNYFQLLLEEVDMYGGDVLKFAGDAFFAGWQEEEAEEIEDMEDAICQAALCGASIVKKYSNYKVDGLKSEVALLNVHCGIGVGKLATLHVGNNSSRREFLFLGGPIDQLSEANDMAANGQLVASPEAIELLSVSCDISEDIISSDGPQLIAENDKRFFEPNEPMEDCQSELQRFQLDYINSNVMMPLKNQMLLYVHPAARQVNSESDSYSPMAIADAELRNVFTIFIKPLVDARIKGDMKSDFRLFSLLNDIMGVTMRELDRLKGHLRQFIVDDKGVVLIATFGLRGATFPNMVTEKGLPAAIAIHDALKIDLDVNSRVGSTIGRVYCGVVGGPWRHEFAVLGPSVNLASRLMSSKNNPGILVDDAVRLMASKRFDFLSHPPVKAKGYEGLVPIFEPNDAIDVQWNKIRNFVGREEELRQIRRIAKGQMTQTEEKLSPHLVFIQAHSGLGKSSLAMQAIDSIRRLGAFQKKEVKVQKNLCKDGEEMVPFCVFRQVILDLLTEYYGQQEEDDKVISHGSDSSLSMDGFDDDDSLQFERLRKLCLELHYSEEFAESVGENMLGLLGPGKSQDENNAKGETVRPHEVIDFVVEAFRRCTSHNDFVVLALDDVHWMDSLSWEVVEGLVKHGQNLMVLCVSRPFSTYSKAFKPNFLKNLQKGLDNNSSSWFTEIQLLPFSKQNIRRLISTFFECGDELIDESLCHFVYEQSGGMPYFSQEIIGNMIQSDWIQWQSHGKVGWRSDLNDDAKKVLYGNLNELLLHRLDNLSMYGRTLLQMCAVLGSEFPLTELIEVECRGKRKSSLQLKKIRKALKQAEHERILVGIYQGGKGDQNLRNMNDTESPLEERWYKFSHAIWRNCLLGTMLKERECDLHRTVAKVLESKIIDEVVEPKSALKVFGHWRDSGDVLQASSNARKIGNYFESLLLYHSSINIYLEAIEMWRARCSDEESKENIAGMLETITMEELQTLAQMFIAIGKNYATIGDGKNARLHYDNCDLILTRSPIASKMEDRSIFFNLYSCVFALIQSGVIVDKEFILQKDLAKRFVEQAEIHGDPVHIARALAMEGLTLGRTGQLEEAVFAQKKLEKMYCAEKLSSAICRAYATDRAAQNYGYSILWYELLGRHDETESQIKFILEDLMPQMPKTNVHNSLLILFQTLWVLKDKGLARKAERAFLDFVYHPFNEFYGEGSTTFFKPIYEPIRVLLHLASNLQEDTTCSDQEYEDMEEWALSSEVGSFGSIHVIPMCTMGRDPHCIVAEICSLLAVQQGTGRNRGKLLEKGLEQIRKSAIYTSEKHPGIEYARRQSDKVMKKLESEINCCT